MRITAPETFPQRLGRLIDERSLSNYRIAKELGVSEGTVRSWRKGRAQPSGSHLEKLAAFLRVDASWLISGRLTPGAAAADSSLGYIFDETMDFVRQNPEALTYIENMLKGVIRGGDFHKDRRAAVSSPKAKKAQRSA